MTATDLKQQAHQLIDQLPDGATWRDIAYQIAVHADAEEGLADIRAGRVLDGDKVLRWIDSWGTEHEIEAPQLPR